MKKLLLNLKSYGLWIVSTVFSFYLFFALRELLLIGMAKLEWNRHLINAIDKLSVLLIGIVIIVFIMLIQHFYTQKSAIYFLPVTALQILLFGFAHGLRLNLISELILLDYAFFLILAIAVIALLAFYYNLQKRTKNKAVIDHHSKVRDKKDKAIKS